MKSLNLETVHIRIYLKIHLSPKASLYLRVEKKKKKKLRSATTKAASRGTKSLLMPLAELNSDVFLSEPWFLA